MRSMFLLAALVAMPATASGLDVKNAKPKPWKKPTVEVDGGRIAFDSQVRLVAKGQKTVGARVVGRVQNDGTDRVFLRSGGKIFAIDTADFASGNIKVDLPATSIGKLPTAPIRGADLARFMSRGQAPIKRISTHDYAAMKQAVDAGKTVVVEVWANTNQDYPAGIVPKSRWDKLWDPVTNAATPVLKPSVSEYSHERGRVRGMLVTHVKDTKNPYQNDRYLHTLFDPESGMHTGGSSSTFKYANTILNAWVIGD